MGYDIETGEDEWIHEDELYDFNMPPEEAVPLTLDQPNMHDVKFDCMLMVQYKPNVKNSYGNMIQAILDEYFRNDKKIWKVEINPQNAMLLSEKNDIQRGMEQKYELLLSGFMGNSMRINDVLNLIKLFQGEMEYQEYDNDWGMLTPDLEREQDIEEIPWRFTNRMEIVRVINEEMRNY